MQPFGSLLDTAWKTNLITATIFTALLLIKSLLTFSRTGPQLRDEILGHYPGYLVWTLFRLALWVLLISTLTGGMGTVALISVAILLGISPNLPMLVLACAMGIVVASTLQFCKHLLHIPGSIVASSNYRIRRLYPLWSTLTPRRLIVIQTIVFLIAIGLILSAIIKLIALSDNITASILVSILAAYMLLWIATRTREPRVIRANMNRDFYNVLMIGSDTLRADRLGIAGYHRKLTPTIDTLTDKGTYLAQCYVPCGRTATSLASLLTGLWPHNHHIRDNFISDKERTLNVPTLPNLLKEAGYKTIAISDWAGADLGKLSLGFDHCQLPEDQWNIRYLLRQGPKDLRLFLSLFTHNHLGKYFLPEIYYLAGTPLTSELGRDTRSAISDCASHGQPFFINVFTSTTHGPFGSEYPFYTMYTDPMYAGDSKFVMDGLQDPFEIVRQQGKGKDNFDLAQILDLYDGCVRNFDDELGKILSHLRKCGLSENTIVIIYSDHGMEFFERDTWGQGNSVVVDEGAHIPVVIYDPRQEQGKIINHTTRSIDIAPTILDLLNFPLSSEMDGITLLPCIKSAVEDPGLYAYMETGVWFTRVPGMHDRHLSYPDLPDLLEVADKSTGTISLKMDLYHHIIKSKDRALRNDMWKLACLPLEDGLLFQLFDLRRDPECTHDVKNDHPDVFHDLQSKLLYFLERDSSLNKKTN